MIATIPTISESRYKTLVPRFGLHDILISMPRQEPTIARRAGTSNWLDWAYEQLLSIGALEHGWDSHGGAPPDENTIVGAWSLLQSLGEAGMVPKPHIFPARSGGVQFEWEHGDRYFEIELVSETEARFFFSDRNAHQEIEGILHEGDSLDDVHTFIDRVRG
jgi:hypothetical protein